MLPEISCYTSSLYVKVYIPFCLTRFYLYGMSSRNRLGVGTRKNDIHLRWYYLNVGHISEKGILVLICLIITVPL